MSNDTIYALSSAPGRSAVAVIRVSGPAVQVILHDIAGIVPEPRRAALHSLQNPQTKEVLDQALVLFFPGPASATGEDLAEFHIHGGRAVTQAVFAALAIDQRCRPAEAGEFALRGFENGKIDLTTAEGIADLVDAETEAQRRQARRQAGGTLARLYDNWRGRLIEAQALIEASIDFSDEGDVSDQAVRLAIKRAEQLKTEIVEHLAQAGRGEIIRSGFQVVIAGPPNAGKSSLLNRLARRDVAIVSEEAGTTRDIIEVHLDLDGLPVIVSDTAGVRSTSNRIETEGIRRAVERASNADLVLWIEDRMYPSDQQRPDLGSVAVLEVFNKQDLYADLDNNLPNDALQVSAKTGVGVDQLIAAILETAQERVGNTNDAIPTNARHRRHLATAVENLETFLKSDQSDVELRAEDLRMAAAAVGRLTGRIDVEDVLDQIFSRFCIGK